MARPASDVRSRILAILDKQLRRVGTQGVTIEALAQEAGCAKGLVHYHFKTKSSLFAAAADQLLKNRERRWAATFQGTNAQAAIDLSWQLVVAESSSGYWRAWTSLAASPDGVIAQLVSNGQERFADALGPTVGGLLREMELVPTVAMDEIGKLLAAAVQGLGLQLAAGTDPASLAGAYSALWAGILGLTRPLSR